MTSPNMPDSGEKVEVTAGKLSKVWLEALRAIEGSAWRDWPERRLKAMQDGLGKHGLRQMRAAGLLTKDGTRYVLAPLGRAILQEEGR